MYDTGNPMPLFCDTSRGEMGRELAGGFERVGTCVCLMLTHVDVWQKPSQYYKVIMLQLK